MNKRIYFDNAATTPLDNEVLRAMIPYLKNHFGNPSSTYSYGRETRLAIEKSRKIVAEILNVKPSTIFFTSGGTESDNTAIAASVRDLGCTHIITSPIEHHAVLHTVEHFSEQHGISKSFVALTDEGRVDYNDLERQLVQHYKEATRCLVTLMNANNETGVMTDIKIVGELCKKYDAIFHTDAVQTVGHYPIDLRNMNVHFLSASGHKFHGPKGTGILYVNESIKIKPLIFGGGQERKLRAGTENVYGIVGFAKALEMATNFHKIKLLHISRLKNYLVGLLKNSVEGISFNSTSDSLYTILSANFPRTKESELLLLHLDENNICVSGGSACSSGSGSHVMKELGKDEKFITVRFSFNRDNTVEEVDETVSVIQNLISKQSMANVHRA